MGFTHEIIGYLEDERFFWTIKKFVPFLNQDVKIMFDKEDKTESIVGNQLKAYQEILKLPDNTLKESNKGIYDNYIKIKDTVEPKPPKISHSDNVWKHIRIDSILIPKHEKSKHTYFFLEMECDWEEEHGLEILFRDGNAILIGQQEGLSCSEEWDDYIK